MKNRFLLLAFILLSGTTVFGENQHNNSIVGYYTRLSFDDHNFTGKFADIVVDIPGKGKFIFSREYSYQPYWQPENNKRFLVDRLIPRTGDGPAERPDKNNVSSNAAIVAKTPTSVTVHWRYAPDITELSFVNFTEAYNQAGEPSSFYAEYADEYFTIHADGIVNRVAKKGCYLLDDWNDSQNQFTQILGLVRKGIIRKALTLPRLQKPAGEALQGEPVKSAPVSEEVIHFKLDEGLDKNSNETAESISGTLCPIRGTKAYWRKGVSGTCLSFDSYSNSVVLPPDKVPGLSVTFSVEAWIAAQEYPFNLAALVDHLSGNSGYLLGMTARGQIQFTVGSGSDLVNLISEPVPLYKWVHVLATFSRSGRMCIYLNGKLAVAAPALASFTDAEGTGLSIGMTRSQKQFPLGAERRVTRGFQTNFVFSGWIDEVSVLKKSLSDYEVKLRYNTLKPTEAGPLKAFTLPYGPEKTDGFGAMYTQLRYSPEWDGIWKVGKYADLIVGFDNKPWRYIFWRGTRYLPSLVTDEGTKGIWSNDQSPEQNAGQCYEHMSDMLCRFSNIRLITSTPARVIVHWRNSSANIGYEWISRDKNGWGVWTDEYWTIYPDGVSVRHQINHNNSGARVNEMNQNEILLHPGQTPEDVISDDAITLANQQGETQTWYRSNPQPERELTGDKNLQYINLKSETKQFQIGETGSRVDPELKRDVYWLGWNHYPVQLIPSDGTIALQYDRPTSSCLATFREVRHDLSPGHLEAMTIFGLTEKKPEELTNLNRAWNFAPEIREIKGCILLGFQKSEKAWYLFKTGNNIQFKIAATPESPVENPVFVIKNWNKSDLGPLEIKINGKEVPDEKAVRKGIEIDTDGQPMLVLWLKFAAEEMVTFDLNEK